MPTAPFIPAEGVALLSRLAKHNSTEWFHKYKDEYRTLVREPMLAVVKAVNDSLSAFAPDYVTAKKDPLSRPNRDTRFSKDKSPYRTDISAVFPHKGLEKHQAAGFFIRVGTDGTELIAGTFIPGPDELRKLRAHIAEDHAEFRKATTARALTSTFGPLLGEQLVRVPAPWKSDHPASDLLRMKQFYYRQTLDVGVTTSAALVRQITTAFRAATPFVTTLDEVLASK
jgi:uncharacterized protein (TIGR02453 family)